MKSKSMFPGLRDFKKAVARQAVSVPSQEFNLFFERLEGTLSSISSRYVRETIERNLDNGISDIQSGNEIDGLRKALAATKSTPFSEVVSPYVGIEDGVPTELGRRLLMSGAVAEAINGPASEVVELMKSLAAFGITFETMSKASYEAFNYAKSNIALASVSGPAKARPLFWLPLGNSLFVNEIIDFLRREDGPLTIVNLGAGPGALEQMCANYLVSSFADRLHVVSVEMDAANLESLAKASASLDKHHIVKGDFVNPGTHEDVEQAIAPGSACFVIAGYALHHISPDNTDETIAWMKKLAGGRGLVQVHDVIGGSAGGGQSQVNRLFFNFMTAYHLLVFHPDSFYTERGFYVMAPSSAEGKVKAMPELFVSGTTPENAHEMLRNGSVVVFRYGGPETRY
jgi:hypothetical protein